MIINIFLFGCIVLLNLRCVGFAYKKKFLLSLILSGSEVYRMYTAVYKN
jgi:hypothetical protein